MIMTPYITSIDQSLARVSCIISSPPGRFSAVLGGLATRIRAQLQLIANRQRPRFRNMLPCGMVHTGNVAVFVFEHIPRSPAPP